MRPLCTDLAPEIQKCTPFRYHLDTLPYANATERRRECANAPWFANVACLCGRVDMRGNGDSFGVLEDESTRKNRALP